MNDNDFRDLCALLAMQVLLKEDIKRGIDKQMGRDWVSLNSFKIAESMVEERNSK
jgi:hypothetical protein